MNQQLVEALADAILALPPDEYELFQKVLFAKIVRKTPGVAGGCACIRQTRIAVWTLISLMNQGADDPELLRNFPGLINFDLWAARSYYSDARQEIDQEINAEEEDFSPSHKRRQSGSAEGQIWMAPDFDAPLEEFQDYM